MFLKKYSACNKVLIIRVDVKQMSSGLYDVKQRLSVLGQSRKLHNLSVH